MATQKGSRPSALVLARQQEFRKKIEGAVAPVRCGRTTLYTAHAVHSHRLALSFVFSFIRALAQWRFALCRILGPLRGSGARTPMEAGWVVFVFVSLLLESIPPG